jgi:hypothetical protein
MSFLTKIAMPKNENSVQPLVTRKVVIVMILAFLPAIVPRIIHPIPSIHPDDFDVYYTASTLAGEHRGTAIYSGADVGVDPELRLAAPGTAFAEKARQLGLTVVCLYVYPPTLADLLIPFSLFPLRVATGFWIALNVGALFLIAYLIARLLDIRYCSFSGLIILLGLFVSNPVIDCLSYGQVTILLLLLWTWGVWLYRKGANRTSAFVFALATAVKVTPIIVLAPLMIWKEWKWLRAYVVSLVAFALAMCFINGPATLTDYFLRVMPPMSHGIPDLTNESLPAAIQLLYTALHGDPLIPVYPNPVYPHVPDAVITFGKLLSLIALGLSALLLLRRGSAMGMPDRVLTLALFAMLSVPVAPVSWRHAYTIALLALALMWREALQENKLDGKTWLLAFCTVAIASYVNQWTMGYLMRVAGMRLPVVLIAFFLPVLVVLLVLLRLLRLRPAKGGKPILLS